MEGGFRPLGQRLDLPQQLMEKKSLRFVEHKRDFPYNIINGLPMQTEHEQMLE